MVTRFTVSISIYIFKPKFCRVSKTLMNLINRILGNGRNKLIVSKTSHFLCILYDIPQGRLIG